MIIRVNSRMVVLDASALLAVLNQEPGSQIVEKALDSAIMSSVNFSETVATLIRIGMPMKEASSSVKEIIDQVIVFDEAQAVIAADLITRTKNFGLSLGDRACLALAMQKNLPVLTADKMWLKPKLNIQIQLIR